MSSDFLVCILCREILKEDAAQKRKNKSATSTKEFQEVANGFQVFAVLDFSSKLLCIEFLSRFLLNHKKNIIGLVKTPKFRNSQYFLH